MSEGKINYIVLNDEISSDELKSLLETKYKFKFFCW